jgi:hypothetical protein
MTLRLVPPEPQWTLDAEGAWQCSHGECLLKASERGGRWFATVFFTDVLSVDRGGPYPDADAAKAAAVRRAEGYGR